MFKGAIRCQEANKCMWYLYRYVDVNSHSADGFSFLTLFYRKQFNKWSSHQTWVSAAMLKWHHIPDTIHSPVWHSLLKLLSVNLRGNCLTHEHCVSSHLPNNTLAKSIFIYLFASPWLIAILHSFTCFYIALSFCPSYKCIWFQMISCGNF